MTSPTIGVVGASARAAVHSLTRAGFAAWAVDLFADRDLAAVAPCAVCPTADYPSALPHLAEQFPPGPVLYTGGLENHPHVVAELAARRELWGNPPAVLEAVRDPWRLSSALQQAGFAVPELVPLGSPCPTSGRWLRKPLRSAGGLAIRFATPGEAASPHHYFQEFVDGPAMSAVFSGAGLVGVTEQLVGEPWLHARPFHYAGSVGPVAAGTGLWAGAFRLGLVAASHFRLSGLWNLDFVARDGAPVAVEVNPRYSASAEVIEHASGSPLVAADRRPARPRDPDGGLVIRLPRVFGKAVYYAPHPFTFPGSGPWDADLAVPFDPWRLPAFADIPAAGTHFEVGQPVVTILVSGSSAEDCRRRLQLRAEELDRLFPEAP